MDLSLSGIEVLTALSATIFSLAFGISLFKIVVKNRKILVNPFERVGFHFRIGLGCALAFVLLSFSWTTFDKVDFDNWEIDVEEIIELNDVPPTIQKPPPPPPPPPIIEEVPPEELLEDEEPEFLDESVEEDDIIEEAPLPIKEIPISEAPKFVPEEESEIEEILGFVESMPRFPGCEEIEGDRKEKEACAKKKMLEYIYGNLNYPTVAMENGVEGTCVIQFVVDKDGSVNDIEIARDIGAGCGQASHKVVTAMNDLPEKWIPGKQRGRKVKVKYTLPIKFKLIK